MDAPAQEPRAITTWLRSQATVPLAAFVAAATLACQPRPRPLANQPLDAWIYDAMADHPAVFTAPPWGYRILAPWLVHLLPEGWGFPHVSIAALGLTAVALALLLRKLGNGPIPSLLAVAAFGLSVPVAEGMANPYLCEPVTVLVETLFLLAVACDAGVGVLALLAVVAALAKEILLVLLPLVYLARRRAEGDRRALLAAAAVALPAVAVTLLMRAAWTPQVPAVFPAPSWSEIRGLILPRLREGPTGILLGGVTPLAVLGALRSQSADYRRRYGYLAAAFVVLPFVAWVYDPRTGRLPFFSATTRRLLIYAVPVLLPLALAALDRVFPHLRQPAERQPGGRSWGLNVVAGLVAAVLATIPVWGLDHYRRVQLSRGFYGERLRDLFDKTLKTAARLENGESVSLFAEDTSSPPTRWFLDGGWGSFSFLATGSVFMHERAAFVLVPCFRPDDLDVALLLKARSASAIRVDVNGFVVDSLAVGPEVKEYRVRLPASALIRGDNRLGLTVIGSDDPELHLRNVKLIPAGSAVHVAVAEHHVPAALGRERAVAAGP